MIDGEFISVSSDSIEVEKRGVIYNAKTRLAKDYLLVGGERLALEPRMGVAAELRRIRNALQIVP